MARQGTISGLEAKNLEISQKDSVPSVVITEIPSAYSSTNLFCLSCLSQRILNFGIFLDRSAAALISNFLNSNSELADNLYSQSSPLSTNRLVANFVFGCTGRLYPDNKDMSARTGKISIILFLKISFGFLSNIS